MVILDNEELTNELSILNDRLQRMEERLEEKREEDESEDQGEGSEIDDGDKET